MKKSIFLIVTFIMAGTMLFAQSFEKGDQAINVGIGFGTTSFTGNYYSGFYPSVSASYEYGIVEVPMGSELTGVVGIGGYLGWSASQYKYSQTSQYDGYRFDNSFMFAARGNYHFIFHDKLDTYAGVWAGYRFITETDKGTGSSPDDWPSKPSAFTGGVYAGARWYFSDAIAAYAELGYLISIFNIGVTFKIY